MRAHARPSLSHNLFSKTAEKVKLSILIYLYNQGRYKLQ